MFNDASVRPMQDLVLNENNNAMMVNFPSIYDPTGIGFQISHRFLSINSRLSFFACFHAVRDTNSSVFGLDERCASDPKTFEIEVSTASITITILDRIKYNDDHTCKSHDPSGFDYKLFHSEQCFTLPLALCSVHLIRVLMPNSVRLKRTKTSTGCMIVSQCECTPDVALRSFQKQVA